MSIIVIGSGLAGYLLVKELRESGYQGNIKVFTKDNGDFYSKPQISNAFALNKTAEQLVSIKADDYCEKYNFELFPETIVTAIEPKNHIIRTNDAEYLYDKCILATGANVKKAFWHDFTYHVNNLQDYFLLRDSLGSVKKIAVIGAGLVGCELASDLSGAGFEVSIFHDAITPIQRLLPELCGNFLKDRLLKSGIHWHHSPELSVTKTAPLTSVNGMGFDLVISALGIEPNVDLAQLAGISVNNGIIVDGFCQTSEADVYALGDCANVSGLNLAYIAPIRQCVNVLAKHLQGISVESIVYPAMPIIVKTPMCKTIIQPPKSNSGLWSYDVREDAMVARYQEQDQLLGFILMAEGIKQRAKLLKEL